jgi:hypothetical protein
MASGSWLCLLLIVRWFDLSQILLDGDLGQHFDQRDMGLRQAG